MLWPLVRPLLRSKFGLLLIGAVIAAYMMGYHPLALIGIGAPSVQPVNEAEDEKRAVFIKKVLKSTEDVWSQLLSKYGLRYKEPVMVLYR